MATNRSSLTSKSVMRDWRVTLTQSEMTPEEAMDQLFDLYAGDVYRFVTYMIGTSPDTDDIIQEVFYRAYVSWPKFRHDANPKTWLLKIARNYVIDERRKKSRRPLTADIEDANPSVEAPYARVETEDLVAKLPNAQRQVVILRYVEGFSVQETAQTLNWTESKVRTTAHRALKRLRTILGAAQNKEGEVRGI